MPSKAGADWGAAEDRQPDGPGQVLSPGDEKHASNEKHLEQTVTSSENLVYDDVDEEPVLHARTYIALAAMFLLNLVQVFALQGPPAVVGDNGTGWPRGPD